MSNSINANVETVQQGNRGLGVELNNNGNFNNNNNHNGNNGNNGNGLRTSYVPPHKRNNQSGPPPSNNQNNYSNNYNSYGRGGRGGQRNFSGREQIDPRPLNRQFSDPDTPTQGQGQGPNNFNNQNQNNFQSNQRFNQPTPNGTDIPNNISSSNSDNGSNAVPSNNNSNGQSPVQGAQTPGQGQVQVPVSRLNVSARVWVDTPPANSNNINNAQPNNIPSNNNNFNPNNNGAIGPGPQSNNFQNPNFNNNNNNNFPNNNNNNGRWANPPNNYNNNGGRFNSFLKRGIGGVGLEARDPRLELELYGSEQKQTMGINFKNYEDIPVEVSGDDVPKPVDSFLEVDMDEVLKSNIQLCGYEKPTPVQKHAMAIGCARRDLMACAQTGSGKTAAFLFPLIMLMTRGDIKAPNPANLRRKVAYPSAVVLAPTRELAIQIHQEARKFVYRTGIRPVVVYGGQDIRNQLREIERGVELLVATPGRLVDMMERGRISLQHVDYLVFDEADRMLDMGFEPQIRQIVQDSDMPQDYRQTLMFSATFPKEIQRLAQDFLTNYVFLAVGRVGSTTEFITQKVEFAGDREQDKKDKLMNILQGCEGLTLIFVETKRGADILERELSDVGIEATSIHGDRSQQERETALAWFRCGRCPVLVATDVASRGLDIPDVRVVVNFDLPNNIDDYVHRIGRTGRCGNPGTAISFVCEKNRSLLRDLHELLKETNQEIPSWFDAMVKQASYGFGGHKGGGHRGGRGPGGFGGRDFRTEQNSHFKSSNGPQSNFKSNNGPSGFSNFSRGGNVGASGSSSAPRQFQNSTGSGAPAASGGSAHSNYSHNHSQPKFNSQPSHDAW